jgi:RNA polymerase primary sigma factor
MAVVTGVESAVQVHINRGDDLDARDEKGLTPLMISAGRNKGAICRLLIAAGADASLLDPSGRSALGIAQAAGALDAAAAIEEASGAHMPPHSGNGQCMTPPNADGSHDSPGSASVNPTACGLSRGSLEEEAEHSRLLAQPDPASTTTTTTDTDGGEDDFDLTGWEVDEDRPAPAGDPTLSAEALAVQSAITAHQPIDTSAGWDDLEAFLPERATPLPRADDVETRERLRAVLLRAIREGSVPFASIEDLSQSDGSAPDVEACALMTMVINDLGAETDERFEYRLPHENFEVWVSPDEKPDEAEALDDALAFVDDLASHRNEALRIYQRELQREPLLTAQAEVALGQAMEGSIEKALDALALWPSGIRAVLDAANAVLAGDKPLRWISSGPPVGPQEIDPDADAGTGIEVRRLRRGGKPASAALTPTFLSTFDSNKLSGLWESRLVPAATSERMPNRITRCRLWGMPWSSASIT